jgi:hypothetical protein
MHSKAKAIFNGIAISTLLLALASEPAAARMAAAGSVVADLVAVAGSGVVASQRSVGRPLVGVA